MIRSFGRFFSLVTAVLSIHLYLPSQLQAQTGAAVADYVSHTVQQASNTVVFTCAGTHKVRLVFCANDVVRVEFDPKGAFAVAPQTDATWAAAMFGGKAPWETVTLAPVDEGGYIKISTSRLTVRVYKSPFRIHFYDETNTTLINQDDDAVGMRCETGGSAPCDLYVQKKRLNNERFFGFGNGNRGFNDNFNCDYTGSYEGRNARDQFYPGAETYAAPFFYSTEGYGIFAVFEESEANVFGTRNTPDQAFSESRWDMGMTDPNRYSFRYWRKSGRNEYVQPLIYYFIRGPQWSTIVDRYTTITGKPPLYHKKFYGVSAVQRCQDDNATAQCVEKSLQRYRDEGFPLDIYISESSFGYDWWGTLKNTPIPGYKWFPDPGDPYWNGAINSNADQLLAWMEQKGFKFGANVNWNYDPPEAALAIKYAIDHGFDVIWRDQVWSGMHTPTAKRVFQNLLSALNGDTSRAFIRHGWATWIGQAFGPHHVGDENFSVNVVKAHLAITLGGFPYSVIDLTMGAYDVMAHALMPMPTYHISGTGPGTAKRLRTADVDPQPWNHPQTTQNLYRTWMRFHQRMVPYLFTYGCRAHFDGMPVWRHMVMMDPKNPATWNKDHQAYVGEWLIVAPSTNGQAKTVWLPKGVWFDWFTGAKHEGEKTFTYAVSGYKLPLFAKAGAIVPMAPEMDYIGQKPEDPLTLRVWPSGSSQFELWEDHTGVKSLFKCSDDNNQSTITIPPFAGSLHSPATRKYELVVHTNGRTPLAAARGDGSRLDKKTTQADYTAAVEGWFYDAASGLCYVKPNGNTRAGFAVIVSYNGQIVKAGSASNTDQTSFEGMRYVKGIGLFIRSAGRDAIEIFDPSGVLIFSMPADAAAASSPVAIQPRFQGVYLCRIRDEKNRLRAVRIPVAF